MKGLHYIFIFYVVCIGSALLMCVGIGNTSLKAPKGKAPAEETSPVRSESDAAHGSKGKLEEPKKAEV